MNLKSVGICALLILIISLMYSTIGVGITLLIFAIMFLVMAILFSIKLKYYDKLLYFAINTLRFCTSFGVILLNNILLY